MLRIRFILILIRIFGSVHIDTDPILESVSVNNGSDPKSDLFLKVNLLNIVKIWANLFYLANNCGQFGAGAVVHPFRPPFSRCDHFFSFSQNIWHFRAEHLAICSLHQFTVLSNSSHWLGLQSIRAVFRIRFRILLHGSVLFRPSGSETGSVPWNGDPVYRSRQQTSSQNHGKCTQKNIEYRKNKDESSIGAVQKK